MLSHVVEVTWNVYLLYVTQISYASRIRETTVTGKTTWPEDVQWPPVEHASMIHYQPMFPPDIFDIWSIASLFNNFQTYKT